MSALRWTTAKPKRSGYYWARWLNDTRNGSEPVVVLVELDALDHGDRCVTECGEEGIYPFDYFKLWSAEPIPEPEGF